jgi:DNA-binding MarR family transcriptional regulator
VTDTSTGGGLGYTMMKAAQVWRSEVGIALRSSDLTVPQFFVLMALYRPARHGWEAPRQSEVGLRLGTDANTTSQIVRALESRGLLTRQPHPHDRRARAISLTDSGFDLARDASAIVRGINDLFFGVIAPGQQGALNEILKTLTAQSEERT